MSAVSGMTGPQQITPALQRNPRARELPVSASAPDAPPPETRLSSCPHQLSPIPPLTLACTVQVAREPWHFATGSTLVGLTCSALWLDKAAHPNVPKARGQPPRPRANTGSVSGSASEARRRLERCVTVDFWEILACRLTKPHRHPASDKAQAPSSGSDHRQCQRWGWLGRKGAPAGVCFSLLPLPKAELLDPLGSICMSGDIWTHLWLSPPRAKYLIRLGQPPRGRTF